MQYSKLRRNFHFVVSQMLELMAKIAKNLNSPNMYSISVYGCISKACSKVCFYEHLLDIYLAFNVVYRLKQHFKLASK